jgi:hypothetical protein
MQMMNSLMAHRAVAAAILLGTGVASPAAILFSDNFDSGASSLWGNNNGSWSASGGVYAATAPNNFPNAFSLLPFNLTNFVVDVDIQGVTDGGIWLRSSPAPGTAVGVKGVLLVLKYADLGGSGQIYWHIVPDGSSYGDALNVNVGSFAAGSNPHVHVQVSGDTYTAFINGATNAATTLSTSAFGSGQVGLYDFSSQTFDNFVLQAPGSTGVTVASVTTPYVEVRWNSSFGSWYQVQIASAKGENKWTNLGSEVIGTGGEISVLVESTQEARFVRVQLLQ